MTALATASQVRAIQAARRGVGLDEDGYRAMLSGFGVTSSKHLTVVAAATLLDNLNGGSRYSTGLEGRSARTRAAGPFAKKLQALWIAGWNLGVVREKDDAAMMALVERQTGIPHTRFLRDPADAAAAIEAIKAMLSREGGVCWPRKGGPGAIEHKRAVVAAQYQLLATRGLYPELQAFHGLGPTEIDALSTRLGKVLRTAMANEKEQAA